MENAPAVPPSPAPAPSAPAEPAGIGEMLSSATTATLDNVGILAGVWLVARMPVAAGSLAVRALLDGKTKEEIAGLLLSLNWMQLCAVGAGFLAAVVLGALGSVAMIMVLSRALQGRPAGLGEILAASASKIITVIVVSVVSMLAIGAGMLLLILPGLYIALRLCLAVQAAVIDDASAFEALGRSWRATKGRFWSVMLALTAFTGIGIVVTGVLIAAGIVLTLTAKLAAGAAGAAVAGLIINALQFFVASWVAACLVRLYFELSAEAGAA